MCTAIEFLCLMRYAFLLSNLDENIFFRILRGLGGFSPYEQFLQISTRGKSVKKLSMDVHRQCLLFLPAYIRKQCLLLRPVS